MFQWLIELLQELQQKSHLEQFAYLFASVSTVAAAGRVAKVVEIGTARARNGMVVGFRRRGQGRWVSGRESASHRPGAG